MYMLTLSVLGGGGLFTPCSKIFEKNSPFSRQNVKKLSLFYTAFKSWQTPKVSIQIAMTNKEVKTETWCKKPPPNTIRVNIVVLSNRSAGSNTDPDPGAGSGSVTLTLCLENINNNNTRIKLNPGWARYEINVYCFLATFFY